jgi:ankyrin repeat protein
MHIAASFGHNNMVHWLLDEGVSVDTRNRMGSTPLINAAGKGYCSLVSLLLDSGADTNAVMSKANSITALHIASIFGFMEVVRLLLQSGADVEAVTADENRTALHLAAERGHLDVTKLLIYSANRHARDRRGLTARDLALYRGHEEIWNLLSHVRLRK